MDVLLASPIFQLEFELRLAGACLAVGMCVFNEFVCVVVFSCFSPIHFLQRLSGEKLQLPSRACDSSGRARSAVSSDSTGVQASGNGAVPCPASFLGA